MFYRHTLYRWQRADTARKAFQERALTSQNRGCTAPRPSSSCSTCSTNRLRSVFAVFPGLACKMECSD